MLLNLVFDPTVLFTVLKVIALFLAVIFIISWLGWRYFAKEFPAITRPSGTSFNCSVADFRTQIGALEIPSGGYQNVVRVVFCEEGVYCYVLFIFRAFHSPFLIPWEKVVGITEKRVLWQKYRVLEIADGKKQLRLVISDLARQEYLRFQKSY